jgi:hypothetical protein
MEVGRTLVLSPITCKPVKPGMTPHTVGVFGNVPGGYNRLIRPLTRRERLAAVFTLQLYSTYLLYPAVDILSFQHSGM